MPDLQQTRDTTVLFCSHDFARGYQYTKEACQGLKGIQVTRCQGKDLESNISKADILVPLMARLDSNLLQHADKAKLILQYGVGLEGVDIQMATKLGIQVSNIPSEACGNALSCAEIAIYLMLCCLRQAKDMAASLQNRVLGLPIGDTIFGKTCLIVGYGNIAKELAPRMKALGTNLIGVKQAPWDTLQSKSLDELFTERVQWPELLHAAGKSDIIVLTCTVTDATRGMFNEAFLRACKEGVVIINVARGGLLDYDATKQGLESGKIRGLGLDVQWQEPFDPNDYIAKHARVYLTPHVGGVTELSYRGMAKYVAEHAQRFQKGLPPLVQINDISSRAA